jgi:UDP-2-acetamido-2,6-beta-L-arabino-hexul-4-ose reductase
MKKVGITGQNGFVGSHLYNTLGLQPEKFERISFERDFFESPEKLDDFVKQCDVIVHLAAMNRHPDPEVIFNNNVELAKKLKILWKEQDQKHTFFSHHLLRKKEIICTVNLKKKARDWAKNNGGKFTGMIIPNVFGPFGKPNYNSFIATFCHKLTHGENPVIDNDGEVKLIYVGELVQEIINQIEIAETNELYEVPHIRK